MTSSFTTTEDSYDIKIVLLTQGVTLGMSKEKGGKNFADMLNYNISVSVSSIGSLCVRKPGPLGGSPIDTVEKEVLTFSILRFT